MRLVPLLTGTAVGIHECNFVPAYTVWVILKSQWHAHNPLCFGRVRTLSKTDVTGITEVAYIFWFADLPTYECYWILILDSCATHIKKNMHFLCFRGTRGSAIRKWQLHLLIFSVCFSVSVNCQFRYSFHEEMTTGSFVGNIVQDLGLQVKRLKSSRARIFTEDNREYIGINVDKGTLVVKERIDRQELCAQVAPCSLHFQIILENPIELLRIDVERY